MSMIKAISDNVVAKINAAAFPGFVYTAKRLAIPTLDLEATEDLQIPVITPAIERQRHNRSAFKNETIVEVGVLQIVDKAETQFTDPLIGLVSDIVALDFGDVIFGGREASFFGAAARPLYDADALEKSSQFISVIRVTYWDVQ